MAKNGLDKKTVLKMIEENTRAANKARDEGKLDVAEALEKRGIGLNAFVSSKTKEFPSGKGEAGSSLNLQLLKKNQKSR